MTEVRWPVLLDERDAEFDDEITGPDATGVRYAEVAAGDPSLARGLIVMGCAVACGVMIVGGLWLVL